MFHLARFLQSLRLDLQFVMAWLQFIGLLKRRSDLSNGTSNWKKEALELLQQGKSQRKIAKELGVPRSTLGDFVRSQINGKVVPKSEKKGPRILIYDLEISPIIAHMWSMWQQGFGLNQIESDWFIMSAAMKWLGEDEIYYYDQRDAENIEDDSYILSKLWDALNECDIAVGQNLKKFDTRKANARFLLNGFPKPSTYRQIDTLEQAKASFGLTSNKLEYLSNSLCPDQAKSKHNEYPGHELWMACLRGDKNAWSCMESYNKQDIIATEQIYNILSSWDNKLPNFDVYVDEVLDMSEWEHDGYHYTNMGKYKRYRNKKTGVQRRSRVNELSKEKRESLLVNIV